MRTSGCLRLRLAANKGSQRGPRNRPTKPNLDSKFAGKGRQGPSLTPQAGAPPVPRDPTRGVCPRSWVCPRAPEAQGDLCRNPPRAPTSAETARLCWPTMLAKLGGRISASGATARQVLGNCSATFGQHRSSTRYHNPAARLRTHAPYHHPADPPWRSRTPGPCPPVSFEATPGGRVGCEEQHPPQKTSRTTKSRRECGAPAYCVCDPSACRRRG